MSRLAALHDAAVEVLETECHTIGIQRRFQADMHDLWLMQARLERRTGKTPFAVARHPRYRAGYDFLLLRSQVGEVSEDLPAWWDAFVAADDDERVDMVREQQALSRRTGDDARRGRAAVRPQGEAVAPADAGEDGERKRRRRRRRKPKAGGDVGAAGSDGE